MTTSSALTCLFLILADHPEVEKRLIQEIDDVIGRDRQPCLEDKHNMPYAEAVQSELLRYLSHLPISVPHKTMQDVEIAGYHLPKNTQVCNKMFVIPMCSILDLFCNNNDFVCDPCDFFL